MTGYDTRDERAALEAEFDELPTESTLSGDVSTVISIRLRGDELATVEQGASDPGLPLSTFIRQAALGAVTPLDVRAASARAEAIQDEVHG